MRTPESIQRALDECGVPYEIVAGKKHQKIFIGGKLIGIFARNARKSDTAGKGGLAVATAIRRAARAFNPSAPSPDQPQPEQQSA